MMKSNTFPFVHGGLKYLFISLASFIFFTIIDCTILQIFSFFVLLFFGYVFRNPERELPNFEKKSVLSPVDGKVILIESLAQEDYAYKITIDSTYKDVGVLRSPMSALMTSLMKKNGAKLSINNPLAKDINENIHVTFENDDGDTITLIHRSKQNFCSLNLHVEKFKTLMQSQRYGFMSNGVTEIYLPHNFRLDVKVTDEIKASEALLGYFS